MSTNKNVALIIFLLVTTLCKSQNIEKLYHENGKLKSIGNKTEGKLTGEWKSYHENGKLREIRNYTDGIKTRKWEKYYQSGYIYNSRR